MIKNIEYYYNIVNEVRDGNLLTDFDIEITNNVGLDPIIKSFPDAIGQFGEDAEQKAIDSVKKEAEEVGFYNRDTRIYYPEIGTPFEVEETEESSINESEKEIKENEGVYTLNEEEEVEKEEQVGFINQEDVERENQEDLFRVESSAPSIEKEKEIPTILGTPKEDKDNIIKNTIKDSKNENVDSFILSPINYEGKNIHPISNFETDFLQGDIISNLKEYLTSVNNYNQNLYERTELNNPSVTENTEMFKNISNFSTENKNKEDILNYIINNINDIEIPTKVEDKSYFNKLDQQFNESTLNDILYLTSGMESLNSDNIFNENIEERGGIFNENIEERGGIFNENIENITNVSNNLEIAKSKIGIDRNIAPLNTSKETTKENADISKGSEKSVTEINNISETKEMKEIKNEGSSSNTTNVNNETNNNNNNGNTLLDLTQVNNRLKKIENLLSGPLDVKIVD